jgi:mRNA-degrading endonuclease RelE of RelBE toxin-antitoxin system
MYKIILFAAAKKELDSLDKKTKVRIASALEELKRLGIHAKHTKKLQPPIGGYRTRVGEYRILFDRDEEVIVIHHISRRADAY